MSFRRNTASSNGPRPPPPTPISDRACGPISGELKDHIESERFGGTVLMVQSNGGLFDLTEAQQSCIRMLESGPAAGVTAAKALCDNIGLDNAIAFDMGGTTAKAGVIHHGQVLMTGSSMVGGYATGLPVQIPMIDIQEVGTGGGSIARVDAAGALHVGPDSAGADPGPVCYGRGGTRADRHRRQSRARAGSRRIASSAATCGSMPDQARSALIEKVAKPLGLDATAAADGILRIATITMSHVVRGVTTERGLDAARFRTGRLWRRRSVARLHDRARIAHRESHRAASRRGIFRPAAC